MAARKALIVGISDYGRLNSSLPGCIRDMTNWSSILQEVYGFAPSNIRLLADTRATKAAILERLKWLFQDAQADDQLVFIFAGHGARIRRRISDAGDLDDNLDEALVAYPGIEGDVESYLVYDDEFSTVVEQSGATADALVTIILDACHSGGMLRDFIREDAPLPRCIELPDDLRHREFARPGAKSRRDVGAFKRFGSLSRAFGDTGAATPSLPDPLIVAAARQDQSAWDALMDDNNRHGVFTYHAVNFLRLSPIMTYDELLDKVTPLIAAKFPQNPTLLGNTVRRINSFLK